ncbi:MAG: PilX N-terminal domain-containing pilus assembly protein, partial [Syntrophorhabdales bacterium]
MSTWTKNRQVEGSGGKEREKYAGCEQGFVLIIVLIIIAALALLGLAANRNMLADIGIAQNHGGNTRAFYAAEAAGEYAYNQLYQNLQQAGNAQTLGHDYTNAVPAITGCTVKSAAYPIPAAAVSQKINATNGVLAPFKGLNCWVQMFTITATATDNSTNAQSTVNID